MLFILALLCGGILAGRLLNRKREVIRTFDRLTTWSIYLLLFLMGVSIGTNQEIMANLSSLGLKAIIIAAFSLAGSILLSVAIYHLFFRKYNPFAGDTEKAGRDSAPEGPACTNPAES